MKSILLSVLLFMTPKAPVIFVGDSITNFWHPMTDSRSWTNVAINGSRTRDMLERFDNDLTLGAFHALHLLGGTNDIRAYTLESGAYPALRPSVALKNLKAIARKASRKGMRVFIGTIPPRRGQGTEVARLNHHIRDLAKLRRYVLVDYFKALSDSKGDIIEEYFSDGLHPNNLGYQQMERVLDRKLWGR